MKCKACFYISEARDGQFCVHCNHTAASQWFIHHWISLFQSYEQRASIMHVCQRVFAHMWACECCIRARRAGFLITCNTASPHIHGPWRPALSVWNIWFDFCRNATSCKTLWKCLKVWTHFHIFKSMLQTFLSESGVLWLSHQMCGHTLWWLIYQNPGVNSCSGESSWTLCQFSAHRSNKHPITFG